MVSASENIEPQINADERRFIDSNIQHLFVAEFDSNLINSPQSSQRLSLPSVLGIGIVFPQRYGTRMTRRDMKDAPQIAEHATPSIWGNPTVICVGSNAGV